MATTWLYLAVRTGNQGHRHNNVVAVSGCSQQQEANSEQCRAVFYTRRASYCPSLLNSRHLQNRSLKPRPQGLAYTLVMREAKCWHSRRSNISLGSKLINTGDMLWHGKRTRTSGHIELLIVNPSPHPRTSPHGTSCGVRLHFRATSV